MDATECRVSSSHARKLLLEAEEVMFNTCVFFSKGEFALERFVKQMQGSPVSGLHRERLSPVREVALNITGWESLDLEREGGIMRLRLGSCRRF